jgi:hypothetical protein
VFFDNPLCHFFFLPESIDRFELLTSKVNATSKEIEGYGRCTQFRAIPAAQMNQFKIRCSGFGQSDFRSLTFGFKLLDTIFHVTLIGVEFRDLFSKEAHFAIHHSEAFLDFRAELSNLLLNV